jgi:hypothetical protein
MHRIFFLCSLLLLFSFSQAQNYQPFIVGKLHFFLSGSNYSVRIDSSGQVGNDSAYWMNEVAIAPSAACVTSINTHFVPRQEGLFGDHFIHRPDGAYQFISQLGDTATFHTLLPTGTPWQFLSDSTLTATISLRDQINLGGQTDSVIVIDISDGKQYRLTQNYGLHDGPNLSYYLRDASLRAAAWAEMPSTPDFKEFFAWQPNDVFSTSDGIGSNFTIFNRYRILQRIESNDGDSLTFYRHRANGSLWPPDPLYVSPADSDTVLILRQDYRFLELATGEVYDDGNVYHWQRDWVYSSSYLGRKLIKFKYFGAIGFLDSCGYNVPVPPPCNAPMDKYFTDGLGLTYRTVNNGATITWCAYQELHMLCYEQAGHDSLGPCPLEIIILGKPSVGALSANVKLILHSRTHEAWVEWVGLVPGKYEWELFDLNGRIVAQKALDLDESGKLPLSHSGSTGMYLLRIRDEAGTWTHTLRVPLFRD